MKSAWRTQVFGEDFNGITAHCCPTKKNISAGCYGLVVIHKRQSTIPVRTNEESSKTVSQLVHMYFLYAQEL